MHSISLVPVAVVRSPVTTPVDDVWGRVVSNIELDTTQFTADALLGLEEFSHVEILFHFDRIKESSIEYGARHPRGRADWPLAGIFAQRSKNRPNRLGSTVCRLLAITGTTLTVQGLDAIDGTPVVDIKPYIHEFGPKGTQHQPAWASALMAGYWGD